MKGISSKDFDSKLHIVSLCELDQVSAQGVAELENNPEMDLENFLKQYPAFLDDKENPELIYIKQPTYKIIVGRGGGYRFNSRTLRDLLKNVNKSFQIYESICLQTQSGEFVLLPEIICLESNLEENRNTMEMIVDIFKDNNIIFNVQPAYSLKARFIRVKSDADKMYISLVK